MARSKRRRSGIAASHVRPKMIFQPILEDGVFRFDCSVKDREAASPSISFLNGKDRDTPISTEKVPVYNPTFEIRLEQQIVKLEVSYSISVFLHIYWLSTFHLTGADYLFLLRGVY